MILPGSGLLLAALAAPGVPERLPFAFPLEEARAWAWTLARNRPAFTQDAIDRAADYAFAFVTTFEAEDVPGDLGVGLPFIESGFRRNSVSRAGARGMFQFLDATAAGEGLADPEDPWESARAAARLLARLHARIGSWPSALAAYNAGPGRVLAAQASTGSRDFLRYRASLPPETRDYPGLVAAGILLVREPEAYGMRRRPLRLDAFPLRLCAPTDARGLAREFDLPAPAICRLNGEVCSRDGRSSIFLVPGLVLLCAPGSARDVAAAYHATWLVAAGAAAGPSEIGVPTVRFLAPPPGCRIAHAATGWAPRLVRGGG